MIAVTVVVRVNPCLRSSRAAATVPRERRGRHRSTGAVPRLPVAGYWFGRRDSNPHCLRQADFKSAASTDFATSAPARSEEHTSELQSLMRISYAVFCLKKKNY